ncbi:hypothetical protein KUL25_04845 [Rhodobacteraceae bacterium N5(2021)]|uniref:Tetratricopeptide repeat-like domain-containing protein n=1 Tax=Gymnodinialimonas phycosphaerae TaxID=2841589 RepID=A0A975TY76_9RHOB|nr:hypothetical protein [Gymnodinialimonas phycosphaerae]MBY4892087.1 hypothetical protein [Gymnodinialimonas phycosphaerae]
MANTDSFIDEVSEEVRRDRLYALMRRWGWIPILVVIAIVGGAAYIEWQSAQQRAQAEAFGDALLQALDGDDTEARIAALEAVEVPSAEAGIILALLTAGEAANGEDRADAATRLRAAADAPGVARRYVDLALLKAEMLDPAPEAEARATLEALAAPGAPYSALAEEQLALMEVRAGDLDAGLDRLRAIERSAAATAGLQQRAGQLIVALESGAILVDAPAEEAPVEEAPADEALTEEAPAVEASAEENAEGATVPVEDGAADASTEGAAEEN